MKPIFKSKTMWLNAAVTALGVAEATGLVHLLPGGVGYIALGLAGMGLRYITDEPIKGFKK